METLFIYLVKSSGLVGMFYLAYFFLLRKETFFNSNRWFLLSGLITSVILPLVVFTKIVWVAPSPTSFDWSKFPVTTPIENDSFEIDWYLVFGIIYGIGIIVFLIKFVLDFYSLSKVLKGKTIQQQADFKFIDVTENISPFSYFDYIVYNSSLYSTTELENILEHEKVHSSQNHTVDVLISRWFCVFFWYNPFVWLYKKAIVQNLEFIADSEASKIISDKKAYQFTLLKITTHENCVAITNHFYQSLIKKRIVMLNKNQSNKRNSWKYAIVLPLLGAFLFLFQIKVVAQEKVEPPTKIDKLKTELHITSNSTAEELNAEKDFFKEEYNLKISFSGIKTNKDNEIIAIKVQLKNKEGVIKANQISGETPINPFNIFAEKDENKKINFGFSTNLNDNAKRHFDLNEVSQIKNKKGNIAIEKDTVSWSINSFKKEGSNCLIVINGQKQTENKIIKIPIEEDVLSENMLDPEAATQKYGKEGKNGAVEIITGLEKKINIDKMEVNKNEKTISITTKTINQSSDNFEIKKISKQKPIIIINGERTEATLEDLNKLDQNLIQSINVLKGKKAIEKYGKDGENGAIEISTKENVDFFKLSNKKSK